MESERKPNTISAGSFFREEIEDNCTLQLARPVLKGHPISDNTSLFALHKDVWMQYNV